MKAHELAKLLLAGPDLMVTVRGYEGGVDEITSVSPPECIKLNEHDAWYYGKHEYKDKTDYDCKSDEEWNAIASTMNKAIHIG